ncbi:hypothetical protein, partial [Zoogloea sp.]|uniref:hypothetical protein n=1 Tax=Zoogloea sp. TaxID=49181 RepID=UPI0025CB8E56
MTIEDKELFYKLMKAGAKQAVKQGASKADLPDDLSKFCIDPPNPAQVTLLKRMPQPAFSYPA